MRKTKTWQEKLGHKRCSKHLRRIPRGVELSVLSDAIRRLSETRTEEEAIVFGNWDVTDGSRKAYSVTK